MLHRNQFSVPGVLDRLEARVRKGSEPETTLLKAVQSHATLLEPLAEGCNRYTHHAPQGNMLPALSNLPRVTSPASRRIGLFSYWWEHEGDSLLEPLVRDGKHIKDFVRFLYQRARLNLGEETRGFAVSDFEAEVRLRMVHLGLAILYLKFNPVQIKPLDKDAGANKDKKGNGSAEGQIPSPGLGDAASTPAPAKGSKPQHKPLRQETVFQMVCTGSTNKEIANAFGKSPCTIACFLSANRAALVKYARDNGYLNDPSSQLSARVCGHKLKDRKFDPSEISPSSRFI